MKHDTSQNEITNSVLKLKTLCGARLEYTIGDDCLLITNTVQSDSSKRKIEIPKGMLSVFINELQEIEKLTGMGIKS